MEGATPVDTVLTYASGPNISTARNLIVDEFLRMQRAPWLLMVDTDMVFAGAAGVPVHVHTGVQVGHMKPSMLGKVI